MCSRPEDYEDHARACDERARRAKSPDLRTLYRDLAYQWQHMAKTLRSLRSSHPHQPGERSRQNFV